MTRTTDPTSLGPSQQIPSCSPRRQARLQPAAAEPGPRYDGLPSYHQTRTRDAIGSGHLDVIPDGAAAAPAGKGSGGLHRWLLPAIAAVVALFIGIGLGGAGKGGGTTGATSTPTVTATATVSKAGATVTTGPTVTAHRSGSPRRP